MTFKRGDKVLVTLEGEVIDVYGLDDATEVAIYLPHSDISLSFLATHVRHADEQPEAPVIEG